MISIFTVPKPFEGHIATIQDNAIQSWKAMNPDCEIVLFGDEKGVGEAAGRFRVRHVPLVARNEFGTPLISDVFQQAAQLAIHSNLCFINTDIVTTGSFHAVLESVNFDKFLVLGRRWNLDFDQSINFSNVNWRSELLGEVKRAGVLFDETGIDYFLFRKGLFSAIPPFAIGRSSWDNWLLYRACFEGAQLVDATDKLTMVHQNHGYPAYLVSRSRKGNLLWVGKEASRNLKLAGDLDYCFNIADAQWKLTKNGLVKSKISLSGFFRRITIWLVLNEDKKPLLFLIKPILKCRLCVRLLVRRTRQIIFP